jgi:hypothetical protein
MQRLETIRALNDALRVAISGGLPTAPAQGIFTVTPGIQGLGVLDLHCLLVGVRDYSKWEHAECEHDFGAVDVHGQKYFWKIDYYDLSMQFGSDDPSNPEITKRVFTLMHASEY